MLNSVEDYVTPAGSPGHALPCTQSSNRHKHLPCDHFETLKAPACWQTSLNKIG